MIESELTPVLGIGVINFSIIDKSIKGSLYPFSAFRKTANKFQKTKNSSQQTPNYIPGFYIKCKVFPNGIIKNYSYPHINSIYINVLLNSLMRVLNDRMRVSNDMMRLSNDPMRVSNDPMRLSKDPMRLSKDPMRVSKDLMRVSNNPMRVSNDLIRISNTSMKYKKCSKQRKNEIINQRRKNGRENQLCAA